MFNSNAQDDEDMLRQMRNLYICSNKLLRTFHYCSTDVNLELFKSYCTSFYCCYLWTAYKKSTFDRLRVAFNNAYRPVFSQSWRCNASAVYANFNINNVYLCGAIGLIDLHFNISVYNMMCLLCVPYFYHCIIMDLVSVN